MCPSCPYGGPHRDDFMDFFFIASKVGWFFLTPSNLILLTMAAGVGLMRWKRIRKPAFYAAVGGAIAAAVVVILPVGDVLVATLERRFPAYEPCKSGPPRPLAGIILLGGAISSQDIDGKVVEDLGPATDRIRKA